MSLRVLACINKCSEIVRLDENLDCGGVDYDDRRKESNLDKLYTTIMDNCHAYSNMEKALDLVGVPLTTELVVEVLHRLHRLILLPLMPSVKQGWSLKQLNFLSS